MNMQCLCASRRQRECEEREGERGRDARVSSAAMRGRSLRQPQAASRKKANLGQPTVAAPQPRGPGGSPLADAGRKGT
jgi:hypothetical protein